MHEPACIQVAAAAAACMNHSMNRPACMLLLQQLLVLHACMIMMRACAAACVIDTMYQLIYMSAQAQAWRIDVSYINIAIFYTPS
jgi:hypothetical protein